LQARRPDDLGAGKSISTRVLTVSGGSGRQLEPFGWPDGFAGPDVQSVISTDDGAGGLVQPASGVQRHPGFAAAGRPSLDRRVPPAAKTCEAASFCLLDTRHGLLYSAGRRRGDGEPTAHSRTRLSFLAS